MQEELDLKEIMPLFAPVYQPEYLELSRKLRQAIKERKFTEETNELAQEILEEDQGDYNAWYIKKMYILSTPKNKQLLEEEQDFADQCISTKSKGFQVWEQKRFLTELGYDFRSQLKKTEAVLVKENQKNYHAWSYRVWLTDHSGIHSQQLQFAMKMIKKDPFNNSAWSHLYFALEATSKSIQNAQERTQLLTHYIDFTLDSLNKHKSNRAGWNFLRGLFPSIRLSTFSSQNTVNKNLISSYDEYPQVYNYCQSQWQEYHKQAEKVKTEDTEAVSIQVLATLIHIHSQSDQEKTQAYAKNICEELKVKEPLRTHYWSWVQSQL